MTDLALHEIEMLEEQKLIGECLRGLLVLKQTGWPTVDEQMLVALSERWDLLEAFRTP